MSPVDIMTALSKGLPITCATCVNYHNSPVNCGQVKCGGPVFGRDFPEYKGPNPREKFRERCLVCSSDEIAAIMLIPGLETRFGLCGKHKSFYEELEKTVTMPEFYKRPIVLELVNAAQQIS